MKNLFLLPFIIFCLSATITNSQELIALTNNSNINKLDKATSYLNTKKISNLLGNKTFSYKYKGEKVTVIFKGQTHTEYFNNKEFHIKSKIIWTSNNSCTMILLETNLPNFPYKRGRELDLKIKKVTRNFVYYESTLDDRTWSGKMKKI